MYHSLLVFFAIIGPIHLVGPRLVEVVVVVWGHDAQALFLLSVGALYQLEDNNDGRGEVKNEPQINGQQNIEEFLRTVVVLYVTLSGLSDL